MIGQQHQISIENQMIDLIPLPHPSGASTWHQSQPGKALLQNALKQLEQHPSWKKIIA